MTEDIRKVGDGMEEGLLRRGALSIVAVIAVLVLAFTLVGCSGEKSINLDREVTFGEGTGDALSLSVSSSWIEENQDPTSEDFEFYAYQFSKDSERPSLSVSYLPSKYDLGDGKERYESMKESALESGYYSNWNDISSEERVLDGAECFIYEYSYSHTNAGDATIIAANIHRDGFYATVSYADSTENFNSSTFYKVLDTVSIEG